MKKRTIIKKEKKILILGCLILGLAMTGCSEKSQENDVTENNVVVEELENVNENDKMDNSEDDISNEDDLENKEGDENKDEKEENSNSNSQTGETLEGNIRSIGESSIVISQAFTEDLDEEGGTSLMWSPAEGSSEEVLVTVNFTDSTKYEIRTVANGGVNGDDDVTVTEGAFSDLEEDISVTLTGHYTSENEFQADLVSIYHFT